MDDERQPRNNETPERPDEPRRRDRWQGMTTGIGMGIALGVGLGLAMENLGLGIAMGIAIGAGIGEMYERQRRDE